MNVSERFPALEPFKIRQQRAREVFILIERLNDYSSRQNSKKGKKVFRRPAGDNWF